MKLRNKKTGEIKDVNGSRILVHFDDGEVERILVHFDDGEVERIESLAELNEEWEDEAEEPKEQPDRLELDKQEILDKIKEIEDLVKNLR